MINFGEMVVEGFASIHKEEFNWGQEGLNIIQAPNGNGKSKFIDALSWCLYGKTLSGSVEPWEHKRHKKYKGTKVEVWYTSELGVHIIKRCKDYKGDVDGAKGNNRLIFITKGEITKEKKKDKIQLEIQESLGYSFDLFINSVIFGQKIKRLITETGPNKKKIFEEAFEMSYIPRAKAIVEKEKKEVELMYYKQKSKVENLREKLNDKREALNSEQLMVDTFEQDKQSEINRLKAEIKDNNEEIEAASTDDNEKKLINLLYKSRKKLNKINETQLNKDIGKTESTIERLFDDIGNQQGLIGIAGDINSDGLLDACPHCKKKYTNKDKKDEVKRNKEHIKHLEESLLVINTEYDIAKGNLGELETTASSITSIKNNIESYNKKLEILESIKMLQGENESLNKKIEKINQKSLKNSTKKYLHSIRQIRKTLTPEKILLSKLKKDLEIKNWLINDPLSNNGLKAFIFNKMLDKLNEKLAYYSKFIPFKVLFDLDMDSHHKNIDTYVIDENNPVPFDDLSGGQQQAVNIATAFAIHDVVSEGKDCNLLIMDELFESLDKDNIEIMSELIQDKAKDKALYLITHRTEFNPTNSNIINIDYKNGFSSVA